MCQNQGTYTSRGGKDSYGVEIVLAQHFIKIVLHWKSVFTLAEHPVLGSFKQNQDKTSSMSNASLEHFLPENVILTKFQPFILL